MITGGLRRATGLVGLAAVGVLTGCGGSDPSASAGASTLSAPAASTTTSGASPSGSASATGSPTTSPSRTAPGRHIVNRSELKAGMCVTEPTGELIDNSLYEEVPCTRPHRYELGAKLDLTRVAPLTDAALEKAALAACKRTTLPAQVEKLNRKGHLYTYTAFFPTKDSWVDGSRDVECFLSMIKDRDLPSRSLLKP